MFSKYSSTLKVHKMSFFSGWIAKKNIAYQTCNVLFCHSAEDKVNFNPIHHDIFSNWFIMSELIINPIWILDMKNSLIIFMCCFLGLVVEQKTATYNFIDPRFKSQMKQLFLSYNFLLGGYFCSSKCLDPGVANF